MSLIHYSFSKTSTCTRPIINSIKSGNYYQFSSRSSRDGPTTKYLSGKAQVLNRHNQCPRPSVVVPCDTL